MLDQVFILGGQWWPLWCTILLFSWALLFHQAVLIRRYRAWLVQPEHEGLVWPGLGGWRSRLRLGLRWFFFAGLMLTGLRLAWGIQEVKIEQEGRHLLIALDTSRSMLAQDVSPSRLELAKLKIAELCAMLGPDRVALILFSSKAQVHCPFTRDTQALLSFVRQVDYQVIGGGDTRLDEAIKKSLQLFAREPSVDESQEKLLLVLTDGEDFSSELPDMLRQAKEQHVKVAILGIGTEQGATVPVYDHLGNNTGSLLDSKRKVVQSKLDLGKMQQVVEQLGGLCLHSGYGNQDLLQVKNFAQEFAAQRFQDCNLSIKQEKYPWFSGVTLLVGLILTIL